MRRRLWMTMAAMPVALLAADTLYWRVAAQRLEAGLEQWITQARTTGWNVNSVQRHTGGWPLAATVALQGPSIDGGNGTVPGGVSWSAERLTLQVSLFRPRAINIIPAGLQRIRIAGWPEFAVSANQMRGTIFTRADGVPGRVTVKATEIRDALAADRSPAHSLTISSIEAQTDLQETNSGWPGAFSVAANTIVLPSSYQWALGTRIGSLEIEGALEGAPQDRGTPAETATAWRDSGGSLQIRRLGLQWGPLDLTGSATLALDQQLQPMGTGTAKVAGYAETLDAFAAKGVLSRSAATAAKAVLSLMAEATDDGQPSEVEVPLTLQYRTLSVRQVPLLRFPEVDWPGQ